MRDEIRHSPTHFFSGNYRRLCWHADQTLHRDNNPHRRAHHVEREVLWAGVQCSVKRLVVGTEWDFMTPAAACAETFGLGHACQCNAVQSANEGPDMKWSSVLVFIAASATVLGSLGLVRFLSWRATNREHEEMRRHVRQHYS